MVNCIESCREVKSDEDKVYIDKARKLQGPQQEHFLPSGEVGSQAGKGKRRQSGDNAHV